MIADTVHSADLRLALADIGFDFDEDSAEAAATRNQLFDMVATEKMLVAGSHIHFPGFGRVQRSGDADRFAPATWISVGEAPRFQPVRVVPPRGVAQALTR